MVKNRCGENGIIFPGGENGISHGDHLPGVLIFGAVMCLNFKL